jgi:hypothetical protein
MYNGHMNIQHSNNTHFLELSLEDAFALQAALTKAIQRVTTVTTEVALRGAKVTHHMAGETVGPLTYEHNGRHYPSSLTIAVKVGEQP